MRNEIKEAYRDSAIPSFDIDDVEETIQISKHIIQTLPIQKYVSHKGTQLWYILRYHTSKILIAQILFCSGLIIYPLTMVHPMQEDIYLVMLFTGFVCMVSTSSEVIRSHIMGTWEMERVCKVSPQRMLLYKSLIFGTISALLICLSSLVFANMYHFPIEKLMLFGFVPFLLITAIILQCSMQFSSREAILRAYIICAGSLVLGGVFFLDILQRNIGWLSLISLLVCLITFFQYHSACSKHFEHCMY